MNPILKNLIKYNILFRMTRADLDLSDWLPHLKAEFMDAILYAEAAIRAVARTMDDGR